MDLIRFATSRWGPPLAEGLCRQLPDACAHSLGDQIASTVIRDVDRPFMRALHGNLAVAMGLGHDHPRVHSAVEQALRNCIHSYIDYFQAVKDGKGKLLGNCRIDQCFLEDVRRISDSHHGLILVGPHTCHFEILMLILSEVIPNAIVLSATDLTPGRNAMNRLRRESGVDIRPICPASLRDGIRRLRRGGVLAMATDIPDDRGEDLIFFNRRCRMAIGHVRLAQITSAAIMTVSAIRVGDGRYQIGGQMIPAPAPAEGGNCARILWAQSTLKCTEQFIRDHPGEWMLPVPIWGPTAVLQRPEAAQTIWPRGERQDAVQVQAR